MEYIYLLIMVAVIGLICFAVYRTVVKKKKAENIYTPFDDATSGTNDTYSSRSLIEDTDQATPYEEKKYPDQ